MAKLARAECEAIIQLDAVRESLRELEALAHAKEDAAEGFTAGCEAVARKAHLEPTVLKRFVNARIQHKTRGLLRQAAQLQLLFGEFEDEA